MRLSIFLFFLFLKSVAFAGNYYVNGKNGSAKNHGRNPNSAKKTIQEASDISRPGDTVFVMNGTYFNDCPTCNVVEVANSGAKNSLIVYKNYPGHKPRIRFNGWAGFSVKGKSYIKIEGFEIVGNNSSVKLSKALKQPQSCGNRKGTLDARYNGNGIAISSKSHHVIISGNTVYDCGGAGIGALHSDYLTVEDNLVYNNCWYSVFGNSGISFYQFWNSNKSVGYKNVIRRNKTFNNKSLVPWRNNCQISDGNGIIIDDFRHRQNGSRMGAYRGRTLIENNITWYNGGTGIHTFQSDHVDIINNTAFCNSQTKSLNAGQILSGLGDDNKIINNILVANRSVRINSNYSNTNLTYENNLHYNIDFPGKELVSITSLSTITGVNPVFLRPSFLLDADFRLNVGSPAINRAHGVYYSSYDFYQKKRPDGNAADIGAVEF